MKKLYSVLAVVIAATLVLAACGGGTAAQPKDLLESIKQRELLVNTIACLNPDELEQLAEDEKKLVRPAKKDSRVVPLRRRVVTKESLAEGFSASLNTRGKT